MTKNKTKKTNFFSVLLITSILFIIVLQIIIPNLAIVSFWQGILIWATKILPALLPFFVLTKLLSYTSFTSSVGKFLSPVTQKMYGVGGVAGYVYIMSILSGYPVGAKLTSDLYKTNKINKGQAHTIASFTSTSGPLFILGTVGIGFFQNTSIGIIVLVSHFMSALINGFLYRNKEENKISTLSTPTSPNFLNESMSSSIMSIMVVGGFIALFYMILTLLLEINAFTPIILILNKLGIDNSLSIAIISGIIEVTTGASKLSMCGLDTRTICLILSFLISFGGLSIHAQAYCFLKDFEMSYRKFLIQKITHATLSVIITYLILLLPIF